MSTIVFIPLTRGEVAVVDFEDFELVRPYRWYASGRRPGGPAYARRTIPHPTKPDKQSCIQMHNQILGCRFIDHVNGNGFDNRRQNLRVATNSENLRSFRRKSVGKSSRFRGVSWHVSQRKWVAYVGAQNRHLGYFDSEEDAAHAHDSAAIRLGLPKESLNFQPRQTAGFKVL